MRVLHVSLNAGITQLALDRAIDGLGKTVRVDWIRERELHGVEYLRSGLVELASEWKPDLTFCQIQTAGILDAATIAKIPGIRVNWTGDVRTPTPEWYFELAPHFTTTLFTNTHDVDVMVNRGCRADYLQIGFDETIYRPDGPRRDDGVASIVFMGNNYGELFPGSGPRREMVVALRKRYGDDFAVYGTGWDFACPNLNESPLGEAEIYRSCKIAIVQNHFRYPRFSSDRILRAMGCGAFCLTQSYPDVDLEHVNGFHHICWNDLDDLVAAIDQYMDDDTTRWRIATNGSDNVHRWHTWKSRMWDLRRVCGLGEAR